MFSFTLNDLLMVFERFNLAVWPLHILAYILGLLAVFFAIKQTKYSMKIVLSILSIFWLWFGIVFCLIYWAPSYKYAYGFGFLSIIQGLLFLIASLNQTIWIIIDPDCISLLVSFLSFIPWQLTL